MCVCVMSESVVHKTNCSMRVTEILSAPPLPPPLPPPLETKEEFFVIFIRMLMIRLSFDQWDQGRIRNIILVFFCCLFVLFSKYSLVLIWDWTIPFNVHPPSGPKVGTKYGHFERNSLKTLVYYKTWKTQTISKWCHFCFNLRAESCSVKIDLNFFFYLPFQDVTSNEKGSWEKTVLCCDYQRK